MSPPTRPPLVVVANRLPVARSRTPDGPVWRTSPGGLVSALAPTLRECGGAWLGWPGYDGEAPEPFEHEGLQLHPVGLSRSDLELFYRGFSNSTLWPLYHDAVRFPEYHRRWWGPYRDVNARFAEQAVAAAGDDSTFWVHDYQLQLVPAMIREQRPQARIGFFLHIPFPPPQLFAQVPWRRQILEGLLGADVIGFQTAASARDFIASAVRFTEALRCSGGLQYRGRTIRVDGFPISIDFAHHAAIANRPEVRERAAELRDQLGRGRALLLGVDRLDYTKGIDRRLRAYETFLGRYEDAAEQATFVQIAVPSRAHVPEYAEIRTQVEQDVGRINGAFGEFGDPPLHYLYRSLDIEELTAYYLAADAMVVTPLRDGMNLVAKEFVASRVDEDGVLVLSEFAGAAEELTSALLVNPHDVDGMAAAYDTALSMPAAERRERMLELRAVVERYDVYDWSRSFLDALNG